mmetsp:Transcript_19711/g.3229  ORF Transcript_19711/g.3229 Transcript_19711/m.3229 type:complete len:106 (+) Transcript_19711:239-556(+)
MVSSGPDLNASDFFVTLIPNCPEFDKKFSAIGRVEEGIDILQKINKSYCDGSGRPFKDIRIRHVYIIDDPFDDPENLIPPPSPPPVKESDRLLDNEEVEADMEQL